MELIVKGDTILYSPEDHNLISAQKWCINNGYVCSTKTNKRMHRLILQAGPDDIVDHINGNRFDNRRENLRLSNALQNGQNKSKQLNKSSQYIGVHYDKSSKKFRAQITINSRETRIGRYDNELDAAVARDMAVVHELPDSYYKLNFPEDLELYKASKYIKLKVSNPIKPKLTVKTFYEDIDDTIIRLLIPAKPNLVVLINRTDYDLVKYYSYHINFRGYIKLNNPEPNCQRTLHRFIMQIADPKIYIDHIDGNKLNNTRNNLRLSDSTLNAQNRKKIANSSSRFIGVAYYKRTGKWLSSITIDGNIVNLGSFWSEKSAALTRDLYIMKNIPNSHYKLNYQTMDDEYRTKNNIIKTPIVRIDLTNMIDDLSDKYILAT